MVILLNSLNRVFIVVGYELNKDYITKVFCINREQPRLHCNGQCHLKKQLMKAEEKENMAGHHPKEKFEFTYWMPAGASCVFNWILLTLAKRSLYLNKGYSTPFFA